MKNLFGLLAVICALLMLCGCNQSQEDTPPAQPPVVDSQQVPQGGILSDVGRAETLQEYYDRTAIISRNEWMEGSFTQTESWAREYAALEYPGGTVTVEYHSGYALPDAMTRDQLSGGVALWNVTVQWPDQPTVWETVQIFYFTETTETGQSQCFSGLLAGEHILDSKPEAYAYLALDTRFASRMQTLPDLTAPEGAQVLELDFFEFGNPQDCQVWMLDPTTAIILSRYREGELPQGEYEVTACLLDSGEIDWYRRDLEGIWTYDSLQKGVLTFRQYLWQGQEQCLRVWMEAGRPLYGHEDAPAEDAPLMVGDYALIWQDGSICLGDEVLLQGDAGSEEESEGVVEMALYNFHQALDDHRFLYSKAGWEWIEHYGVYDLATREAHVLPGSGQAWDYEVLQVSADGGSALAWCREDNYLELVDLRAFTARKIALPAMAVEQVAANEDLSRIALLRRNTATEEYSLVVLDSAAGDTLYGWNLPADLIAGTPELQLTGQNTLMVNFRQWKTDTDWIYRITY